MANNKTPLEQIQDIFQEFQDIQASYMGKDTDWSAKSKALDILITKLGRIKLRSSQYSIFYEWVLRQLHQEINQEHTRVWKLAITGKGV